MLTHAHDCATSSVLGGRMAREAIFIGYRRDDTADVAGRIFDALILRFGRALIFMDVDNLRPGIDFGDYIRTVLPRCRVALVLIGPDWIEARDGAGRRRLDDTNDWVRIEVETALATAGLDVVPVLVNGARMPRDDELPQSLHPLLRRHAAIIRRDPDFHDDVRRLEAALRASLRTGVLDLAGLGGEGTDQQTAGAIFSTDGPRLNFHRVLVQSSGAQRAALDVHFSIAPGEILGVIGPSGAGKSLLARVAMGVVPPDSGTVMVGGARVTDCSPDAFARFVGYMPEELGTERQVPSKKPFGVSGQTPRRK